MPRPQCRIAAAHRLFQLRLKLLFLRREFLVQLLLLLLLTFTVHDNLVERRLAFAWRRGLVPQLNVHVAFIAKRH